MPTSYLYFPQWQGSGPSTALARGAEAIRRALGNRYPFTDIPVEGTPIVERHGILGYDPILAQLRTAVGSLNDAAPEAVYTLGGDCGIELAPVGYLHRRYGRRFGVVWLDAHSDINTPETSPSKHFHGMPLRALLGDGDPAFVDLAGPPLAPEQVVLVGTREMDPKEGEYVLDRKSSTHPTFRYS
jgi:arginase